MKQGCFLRGFLGTFLALAIAAVVVPQYSDYRARAQTDRWLREVGPLQNAITDRAIRAGTLRDVAVGLKMQEFAMEKPEPLRMYPDGVILMKGGNDGQMIVLIPTLDAGEVTWRCIGGSDRAVPARCRLMSDE